MYKKLSNYNNLDMTLTDYNNSDITLTNLKNLETLTIENCKITLILDEKIPKFKIFNIYNSEVEIIDKFNYLKKLNSYTLNLKQDNIILDENYIHATDFILTGKSIKFKLKEYYKLKFLKISSPNININSKFPSLKTFYILNYQNKKVSINLNESKFSSLENFYIKSYKVYEFNCDYEFSNLKIVENSSDILYKFTLHFTDYNDKLKKLIVSPKLLLSSSFLTLIPNDFLTHSLVKIEIK